MEKRYGKISGVTFGHGGYQDACIGIHFSFQGKGWGVGYTKSAWDPQMIERSTYAKWTDEERDKTFAEIIHFVSKLLKQAKVSSIEKLKDVPVECTFDGNTLKDWRIFEEVL